IMPKFTNFEMADKHFAYGLANDNSRKARRIYAERYPQRNLPCHKTFANIHRYLRKKGSFVRNTIDLGKPMTVRTPVRFFLLEEAVLNEIEAHPETSKRKISRTLNVSNILKDQQLYPYHIQRVQKLLPCDFPQKLAFCQWILQRLEENPQFLSQVLFADEANFSRNNY
ncbi:hypothetical protein ALC57_16398, partial [Trachymyrmex cornetzi]